MTDLIDKHEALINDLSAQVAYFKEGRDTAYSERNKLVALLSKTYPASIEKHDGADWEDDWRNVIFIELPTGQVSWHIHDSELYLFDHLTSRGLKWDGHTTEEKYERCKRLTSMAWWTTYAETNG